MQKGGEIRMKLSLLAFAALILFLSHGAQAHPGGRDSNGGHFDRSSNEYHCHTDGCVLPDNATTAEDLLDPPDGEPSDPITVAGSWGTTKVWARNIVYTDQDTTFYCGCTFTPKGTSGGNIDQTSCSYDGSAESHSGRDSRLEWEHVIPASLMATRSFTCWNEGLAECQKPGRECCEKHDLNARVQIFDLHNLVPSIGQVNALRSNKRYGDIPGEERKLGPCDFEWNRTVAEPPTDKRGEIARIWLYYVSRHGLQLRQGELETFLQWSQSDPPEQWEFTRNTRIKEKQGNGNPFVEMFQ